MITLLGVFSGPLHRQTYPVGNVVDWVTVLYACRDALGQAQAGDDAAQVQWFPLRALPAQVSPATRAYFAALRGKA